MEVETNLAKGCNLDQTSWDDFVKRLHHDCEGAGVNEHYTADAIFLVQSKRLIAGIDKDYCDDLVCFCEDYKWFSPEEYYNDLDDEGKESIDKKAQEEDADSFLLMPKNDQWALLESFDNHYVTGYKWEWQYVNSHLTKDAAEAFIKRKKHDYPDGIRVYVDSQYQAWEYNAIKRGILNGSIVFKGESK